MPTVSKLHLTSINAFSDKSISNKITMTPFSNTVLATCKNFAPEDKPVYRMLGNASCKLEFVTILRYAINHILCKSFLSHDPIPFCITS